MKQAFITLSDSRLTSESELAREAFIDYLKKHGITLAKVPETPTDPKVLPDAERQQKIRQIGTTVADLKKLNANPKKKRKAGGEDGGSKKATGD